MGQSKIKIIFFLIIVVFLVLISDNQNVHGGKNQVEIYFFWAQGCPHCATAKSFLEKMQKKYPMITIISLPILHNRQNQQLFNLMARAYAVKGSGVPAFFIGNNYLIGFDSEFNIGRQIETQIIKCLNSYCPSPVDKLKSRLEKTQPKKHNKTIKSVTVGAIILILTFILTKLLKTKS